MPTSAAAKTAAARKRTAATKPKAKSVAAPAKAAKAAKPVKPPKAAKPAKREALVRDSFTMPQADFALIATLKDRALQFKRPVKKSELLRAGLQGLTTLSNAQLQVALDRLAPLRPGRPKKMA